MQEAITITGDSDETINNQAKLLEAKGELALAEAFFRKAYNNASNADSLNDLVQILIKQGKKAEAIQLYQNYLNENRDVHEDILIE